MSLTARVARVIIVFIMVGFCASCAPIYSPYLGTYVPIPIPMLVSWKIEEAHQRRASERRHRVYEAIKADDAVEFAKAWKACGEACDANREYKDYGVGGVDSLQMHTSIAEGAWKVLAYQLSIAPPEFRQRLLHTAGGFGWGGSKELVVALISSGAQADGIALANGVTYCRQEMVDVLLANGAEPRGSYTVKNPFNSSGESVSLSLLSIAAAAHCQAGIRESLIAHRADPNDVDPVLIGLQAAIGTDDARLYGELWGRCKGVDFCSWPGWRVPRTLSRGRSGEIGWVDEAISRGSWRIVSSQIGRMSDDMRDEILKFSIACYPNRPDLKSILNSYGAKSRDFLRECNRSLGG
ncbi:hypothetical protein [Burkholderia sp. PU8-34]